MLTGLDGIVIEVGEFEAAVEAYSRLLDREPEAAPGECRAVFALANTRLELRGRGERGSRAMDGLVALRLAFRAEESGRFAPGPLASPTVAIELVVEATPRLREEQSSAGIAGLDHVVIATVDPERTRAFLAEDLGIRLALDRSFPERGLRLLFFRLGGVTLELAAALAGRPEPGGLGELGRAAGRGVVPESTERTGDAFHGLAWKVRGLEETRARLVDAGFALSPTRPGHKAGTRVCSLGTPLYGVPTLLIEHPPRPGEAGPSDW